MIIRLFFLEYFEGRRIRAVGVFYDMLLDDGTGAVPLSFEGEVPRDKTRIDVIGTVSGGVIDVERWREIDLETELRRRLIGLKEMKRLFGDVRALIEEAKGMILQALAEGSKTHRELREELKDRIKLQKVFERALQELLNEDEIIQIEPGRYMR